MENYIKKINDRLTASGNTKNAKRVKFSFQLSGGLLIAIGLAGFLASFITFMVLFFKFKTDDAFIAWLVAIPFLVAIVIGAVLARIGDVLLPEDKTKIDGLKQTIKEFKFVDKKDKVKGLNKVNEINEQEIDVEKQD